MKLNIPYFRQEKNTTCGVACLRMVMAFYSKDIKEFELEEACETGWLGNTCGELVQCVKKYGFEAEEVENITTDYVKTILRKNHPIIALLDPAILYGGIEGFGHFVVITGLEDDKICYNDPDMDKEITKNITDFFKAWNKFSFKGVRIWKSMIR
jgi:ABC-type bacteriocin/lantibiotic exporter with double-glycine peptidase domain